MNNYDAAANIAVFLTKQNGTSLSYWHGKMSAKEQRELFGKFLGKGTLYIDGEKECIEHSVKVCFGTDFSLTAYWDLKTDHFHSNR